MSRATSTHGSRMTLHRDRLRMRGDDLSIRDTPVTAEQWEGELRTWYELSVPAMK